MHAIIDKNYQRAETILRESIDKLHAMADALIKYETIDAEQIDDIMNGKQPSPPSGWIDMNNDNKPNTPVVGEKSSTEINNKPASEHWGDVWSVSKRVNL